MHVHAHMHIHTYTHTHIHKHAGWWHAVLNLDLTIAITANHLVPQSLPEVWPDLVEVWPRSFSLKFLEQCAEKWPQHVLQLQKKTVQDFKDTKNEEEDEMNARIKRLVTELSDLTTAAAGMPHGVLFLDADGCLKDDQGCLRSDSVRVLQQLVHATNAEIVVTSASRAIEITRQTLKQSLNRWGLSYTRWITTGEMPGGRSSQILDFVTRNKVGESWVVIDSSGVGQIDGPIMMQLLYGRCCVVDARAGLTAEIAMTAAKILLGLDDDDDDE
jgi:hypothetical protein